MMLPVEISDLSLAFPADAMDYMPAWKDIPDEFKGGSPWRNLPNTWMTYGLSARFSFQPAILDGKTVDAAAAFRQLRAIMGSFAPKHEHKIATVAYLSSLWMESVVFGKPDCSDSDLSVLGEATLAEWLEHFASEGGHDVDS